MTITYVNDLRLSEMATGDNSGTWGNVTNTNLELVGDALGYGTEAITTNADTHASTIADGSADAARAMYIKYTGTLDSTCTITIGPNTISRVHIIENATSGSQSIIISQGSGANVTIGTGAVKVVYLDGAGSGAAVTDALVDLDLTGTTTVATLTASGVITGSTLEATGDTSSGDNAAIGYTSAEGLILTGQGSTNDVTIKNDADADVISIPTGTTGVTFAGAITGTTATLVGANTLTLRNDTSTDANEPKLIFDNDSFSGANYANITTGNGGLLMKIESPSTSTYQNRHQILMNGGAGDDIQFNLSTDNGSNYVNYFKIDGGNATFNETGADKDFRVESSNSTHMLFVDASADAVGIRKNDPSYGLDVGVPMRVITSNNLAQLVLESTDTDNGHGPRMNLVRNPGEAGADGDNLGQIYIQGYNDAGTPELIDYFQLFTEIEDASDGTEDARQIHYVMTGGSQRSRIEHLGSVTVINEDGQDIDFRIEASEAYAFFVQGSSGGVQMGGASEQNVGTPAPGRLTLLNDNNSHPALQLFRQDTSIGAGGNLGEVTAYSNDTADNDIMPVAQIMFQADGDFGNTDNPSKITFFTTPDSSETIREIMRLGNAEAVVNESGINYDFRIESDNHNDAFYIDASADSVYVGKATTDFGTVGIRLRPNGALELTRDGGQPLFINRLSSDGNLVEFYQASSVEGTISVSGSTVSYNGFSGLHESSGIADNIAIGTVCSTIDELDVYSNTTTDAEGNTVTNKKAGQTRADHAKIKVSDTEGDKRVYGVLQRYDDNGKPLVASVGIGSIKVTGVCEGGDLLESNGDGTAKVQSDDIIRSKTIGKVTIGNSNTGVKLVSCVLYCG
jgi:hypothetical protein